MQIQLFYFLLIILSSSSILATRIPRLSPIRRTILGAERMIPDSIANDFNTYYYDQTLDHFNYNPISYKTFKQRYVVNEKFWGSGANRTSPIFAYFGAEAPLDGDIKGIGFLTDTAPLFKSLLIYIEHRFYGKSVPFGTMDEAMKNNVTRGYFNSIQALADYAEILLHVKEEYNAHFSPIIVVGGSYGGMLASWFRLKYPHIALGALASSAPILYFDNITPQNGYYHIVTKDFKEVSENCYETIRQSWSEIDRVAAKPSGLSTLSRIFKTCSALSDSSELKNYLESIYASAAQYNHPPNYPVTQTCRGIDGKLAGESTSLLGRIFAGVVAYRGNRTCYDFQEFSKPSETLTGWRWQAHVVNDILTRFCNMTGQKVSNSKSRFFTSKNVSDSLRNQIGDILHMHHTSNLGRYLGTPLLHSRLVKGTFSFVIDKMRKKLASWKSTNLSRAGRSILVTTSLSSLPYYVMQTIQLAKSNIDEMERICRSFFWGDHNGSRKFHTIAWSTLCQPKTAGGLGFKQLQHMNTAFLGKLVWNLLTDDSSLWVQVLIAKYGSPFLQPKAGVSIVWRSICKAALRLQAGYVLDGDDNISWNFSPNKKYTVHSAYSFLSGTIDAYENIWEDIWKMKGPLRYNFTLWQATHNALPTEGMLFDRYIASSNVCNLCNDQVETQMHALRDCKWPRDIWSAIVPDNQRSNFFNQSCVKVWIQNNIVGYGQSNRVSRTWAYYFRDVIHYIWWWRNAVIHNEDTEHPPVQVFLSKTVNRARSLRLAWNM